MSKFKKGDTVKLYIGNSRRGFVRTVGEVHDGAVYLCGDDRTAYSQENGVIFNHPESGRPAGASRMIVKV